jgi:hypothetical protein
LPIDVQQDHVSCLLYKLKELPEEEKKHFSEKNIFPRKLSPVAYKSWFEPGF